MFIIKPRKHEPTSHKKSAFSYIPRFIKIPYKIIVFCYDVSSEMVHSGAPGIFKIMIPLALVSFYFHAKEKTVYEMISYYFVFLLSSVVMTILKYFKNKTGEVFTSKDKIVEDQGLQYFSE